MPRPISLLLLAVLLPLGACSSDEDESASPTTSSGNPVTTAAEPAETSPPAWIATVTDAKVVRGQTFEGHVLWLDEERETVYVQDCEIARRATREGGPYGPEVGPGHAYICQ